MKYQLTEKEIELFRSLTPLKVDNKLIPFRICCNGKFYADPRGFSPYIVHISDFSCRVSYPVPGTKEKLQEHFVSFMSNLFEDYAEDYQAFLDKKAENESQANI